MNPNDIFLRAISLTYERHKLTAKARGHSIVMYALLYANTKIRVHRFECMEAESMLIEGVDSNKNLYSLVAHYKTFQVLFSEVEPQDSYQEEQPQFGFAVSEQK